VSAFATILAALLSIGLLCARRTETALWLSAAQGLCAAAALGASGSVVTPAVLLLNAVAVPLVAWRVLAEAAQPAPPPRLWLLAALLLVSAAAGFGGLGNDMASGIAVVLLGLLIATQGNPAIGLLSAQNGVALVAAAIPDLSLGSVLAAAVPLLPAILLGHAWHRR
jgi:hypothetical protein